MSDDAAGATDCPICLCPIASSDSEPWGVAAPCGHPYHRSCWDQVVAATTQNRRTKPKCAICKAVTRSFVPVFLELGGGCGEVAAAGGDADESGDESGEEGDDALELVHLVEEWDDLWKELETICGYKDSGDGNSSDDSVVDVTDSSDRYIAAICETIDLTQQSPDKSEGQTKKMQLQEFHESQPRMHQILKRLKCLHREIVNCSQISTQQSSLSSTNKQIQRLKNSIMGLQTAKSNMATEKDSLQSTNESLTAQMEKLQQTALDRTVEAERANRKHEKLQSEFTSMESSYKHFMGKSQLEKASLQTKIAKLQKEYHKLSNRSGFEDMNEMEEIRKTYNKMTQDLHSVKARTAKKEKEFAQRDREWEIKFGREQRKVKVLEGRLQKLLDGSGTGHGAPSSMKVASDDEDDLDRSFASGRKAAGAFSRTVSLPEKSSSKNYGDMKPSKAQEVGKGKGSYVPKLSLSKTNGNVPQRKSTAMAALDKASTTRKRSFQKLQSSQPRKGSASGVELMMRPNASKKRRSGSGGSTSQSSDRQRKRPPESSSSNSEPARTFNGVSASMRQAKGNISSFFRPVNADDADC